MALHLLRVFLIRHRVHYQYHLLRVVLINNSKEAGEQSLKKSLSGYVIGENKVVYYGEANRGWRFYNSRRQIIGTDIQQTVHLYAYQPMQDVSRVGG